MGKKAIFINENKLEVLGNKKYLLPNFLFAQLQTHHTSLGNNPAFPPERDTEFDYDVIKKRFKEVVDAVVEEFGEEMLTIESSESTISSLLRRCKDLERPIRQQLEKVAYNAINGLFAIPKEVINYDCKLVDKVKFDDAIRITPESDEESEYEFADVNDVLQSSEAIAKRRVIDSLIQGGAYELSLIDELYLDEIEKINSELPILYKQITILSDYLLFAKKEKMTDDKPKQGSFVTVKVGGIGKRTEILAQGIIFPLMYKELIRGFLEQFSMYGLPVDSKKAQYIVKKADFILTEPWDMRFGTILWKHIMPNHIDTNAIPYYFKEICQLNGNDFNNNIKETFAQTNKGKEFKETLYQEVQYNVDYQHFVNDLQAKNVEKSLMNDGYFSAAELDSFILDGDGDALEDEILTDEVNNEDTQITENQETEGFSTPDTSYLNGEKMNWGDEDAIPFFILKNGVVEFGKPRNTHQHYYLEKYGKDKASLNKFINSIVLQGRYWKNNNVISFWQINGEENLSSLKRKAVKQVGDLKRDCFITYRDTVEKVMVEDDGFIWFKNVTPLNDNDEPLVDERQKYIEYWWNSDKKYVENTFVIRDNIGSEFFQRKPNEYEIFAITCHQIWADKVRSNQISSDEMKLFISLKTHGRLSFDEGLTYFAKNLRNKAYGNIDDIKKDGQYQTEGRIEDLLNALGISRSEYSVVYYEDSGKPYSYNIHITDEDRFRNIINAAKEADLDVGRVNKRRFNDTQYLYTARLREKFPY